MQHRLRYARNAKSRTVSAREQLRKYTLPPRGRPPSFRFAPLFARALGLGRFAAEPRVGRVAYFYRPPGRPAIKTARLITARTRRNRVTGRSEKKKTSGNKQLNNNYIVTETVLSVAATRARARALDRFRYVAAAPVRGTKPPRARDAIAGEYEVANLFAPQSLRSCALFCFQSFFSRLRRRHVRLGVRDVHRGHGRVHQQSAGEARPAAGRAGRAPRHPRRHEVRVPVPVRRHRRLPQVRKMGSGDGRHGRTGQGVRAPAGRPRAGRGAGQPDAGQAGRDRGRDRRGAPEPARQVRAGRLRGRGHGRRVRARGARAARAGRGRAGQQRRAVVPAPGVLPAGRRGAGEGPGGRVRAGPAAVRRHGPVQRHVRAEHVPDRHARHGGAEARLRHKHQQHRGPDPVPAAHGLRRHQEIRGEIQPRTEHRVRRHRRERIQHHRAVRHARLRGHQHEQDLQDVLAGPVTGQIRQVGAQDHRG